jgi:DnaJ-class molecular chaperone
MKHDKNCYWHTYLGVCSCRAPSGSEFGAAAGSKATASMTDRRVRRCPDCGGKATSATKWCRTCDGLGWVRLTPVDNNWR